MDGKGAEAEAALSCLPAEAATAVCNFVSSPFPTWSVQRELQLPQVQPSHIKRSWLQTSITSKPTHKTYKKKNFLRTSISMLRRSVC